MRHRVAGKQLSRTTSHRRALRRNMAASLFEHGAIKTTEAKAKELRRFVEKLITTAKKGTLAARRTVIAQLQDRNIFTFNEATGDYEQENTVVSKLFEEIAPKYANRRGGYTRIIRVAERRIGDGGKQVILQLVEEEIREKGKAAGKRNRQAAKRHEAVDAAAPEAPAVEEAPAEEKSEE